jgi:molybdopterin-guanine dinucleotide biosynthesis protein
MQFTRVKGDKDIMVAVVDHAQTVAVDNPTRDEYGLGFAGRVKVVFLIDGKSWGAVIDPILHTVTATADDKIRVAR